MDKYNIRGVSSDKEDVHSAIKNLSKGLYPDAFCKIIPDYLTNDDNYCLIMHSDGAGTKSSLAYIYYKETGDISVFEGIAMDAIVMNIDDLLCIGATNNFIISNTIDRNKHLIDGEIINKIISSNQKICEWFTNLGINCYLAGGETADIGDIVKTILINSVVVTRMKRAEIIDNNNIKPDMVIIGLASYGQSKYENVYNSGISSNGLTSARHDLLNKIYKEKYPESYDINTQEQFIYSGKYLLTDKVNGLPLTIGKALLSPTRTYAPVIKEILNNYRNNIGGIIHCTGGGQTKCLKFGKNIHYIKNNLFDFPPIFKIIKEESKSSYKEMFKTFNCGHRIEIFVKKEIANDIISISKSFNIDAKIIGKTESSSEKNKLTIDYNNEIIEF